MHLVYAMIEVYVQDVCAYPLEILNSLTDKPKCINWVGVNFEKNTLIVVVKEEYDLQEINAWLQLYENA